MLSLNALADWWTDTGFRSWTQWTAPKLKETIALFMDASNAYEKVLW